MAAESEKHSPLEQPPTTSAPTLAVAGNSKTLRRSSFSATELSSLSYQTGKSCKASERQWQKSCIISDDSLDCLSSENVSDRDDSSASTSSVRPVFFVDDKDDPDDSPLNGYVRSWSNLNGRSWLLTGHHNRSDAYLLPRKASEPQVVLRSSRPLLRMPPCPPPPAHHPHPPASQQHLVGSNSVAGQHGFGEALRAWSRDGSQSRLSAYDNHMVKRLQTEQVMDTRPMKGTLTHFQGLLDTAFSMMAADAERSIVEGATLAVELLQKALMTAKIGRHLLHGLCDYARESGYLDLVLRLFSNEQTSSAVRLAAGKLLERCVHPNNRAYIVQHDGLEELVAAVKSLRCDDAMGVRLLEPFFKDSADVNTRLIDLSALDYILGACKTAQSQETFRYASQALANLAMFSDSNCQQAMIARNVPEWLFLLASGDDLLSRYYACLAVCALVSSKEVCNSVIKSGTLSVVEPFLQSQVPAQVVECDRHADRGQSRHWLERLVQLLGSKRPEPRSMAAFHFAVEAELRKEHNSLNVLREIGAVEALKRVAELPGEIAPVFATQALQIIGESAPYKLTRRVPEWSVEDVQHWVANTGFKEYAASFKQHQVDGDLLLTLTEQHLVNDIGMQSGLLRKRFMRELDGLRMIADYRNIDETKLDSFLVSIHPRFSIYTYRLLESGVDRTILPELDDETLKTYFAIENPIHRTLLLRALEAQNIDDVELALLSKKIDIFISYRRSTGNQLASLIKVLLQLRGYKVFIDVERLSAGQFDCSLLKNIQAAKHFVLVLTHGALDRCMGDEDHQDWVHKELVCALENGKNIIPVIDANFIWPDEHLLPSDIRQICKFNGLHWVHEYQDACVDKLEKFICGDVNPTVVQPVFSRRSSVRRSTSKLNVRSLAASSSTTDLIGDCAQVPVAYHQKRITTDDKPLLADSLSVPMSGERKTLCINGCQQSLQRQTSGGQSKGSPDIVIDYCC